MATKNITPVSPASADGLVAEVYAQIKRDFGAIVEPFSLHSPSPKLLAGVWTACRETELIGIVPRNMKEIIAAAVSTTNQCPYCVDAHTIMLDAVGEHKASSAISKKTISGISDPKLRDISEWALSTRSPNSTIIHSPPFSQEEAPEIIGMAVLYHYINKMVSFFLTETPLPSNRGWLKGTLKRMAGWYFSFSANRPKLQGESLRLLPDSELPSDLIWAQDSQWVAQAFARFAAVIDEIGEEILSEDVRHCVQSYVKAWDGESPGISRQWVEQAIQNLDDKSKVVGRVILTTAIAPYQVDDKMIEHFRADYPKEETLLGVLAWGSFTVARRIGTWLYTPSSIH
jgi:AhpD family alkylhydroperoxidase